MNRRPRLALFATASLVITSFSGVIPAQAHEGTPDDGYSLPIGLHSEHLALSGSPASLGQWLSPFSENGTFDAQPPSTQEESKKYPTAVSSVALPSGQILYWNGLEGTENLQKPIAIDGGNDRLHHSRTRLLDLASRTWQIPTPEDGGGGDLFCSDQRLLADGRVLAVGGTEWSYGQGIQAPDGSGPTELLGRKNARVYTPDTSGGAGTWTQAQDMSYRRWYPALVTLPSGNLLVASGVAKLLYNDSGVNVPQTETFDPSTLTWTDNGESGATSLPLFPRLHLLPNGKVLYDATGQMWGPFGQAYDEALWNMQKEYDPATNKWEDKGLAEFGARSGSFSAMLPLKPDASGNYNEANILIAGGTIGTSPGTYIANSISEIVTSNGDNLSRKRVADLNNRRWYSSGVVLPSGEVLAFNGADKDEVIDPGSEFPVRQAEMYDPASDKWTALSSDARDRTYHNSAILLKDGSVLIGGHSPIVAHYGNAHDNYVGPPFANNFKDPSFEIYKPPYLFRGDRPSISAAPASINWGQTFDIGSPDAGHITSVVLSRLPATTHITDADQRTVELPIVSQGDGTVTVKAPGSHAVIPGGYYYLFVLKDNGQGATPSVAATVNVGASATPSVPATIKTSSLSSTASPDLATGALQRKSASTTSPARVLAASTGGRGYKTSLIASISLAIAALLGVANPQIRKRQALDR